MVSGDQLGSFSFNDARPDTFVSEIRFVALRKLT
jgi:hypothetical protein